MSTEPSTSPAVSDPTGPTGPTEPPTAGAAASDGVLPAHLDLAANDHDVIAFWAEHDVFRRSLAGTARPGDDGDGGDAAPQWTFYEGPPTANGKPGTHHVEARAFKDVFPRFKTMKGYRVPRMAGWDCHGLPVELAVEKELGFTGKPDIEAFGIAEFNAACRDSVLRNVGEFEAMSERMGYWADYENPYRTMDPAYIQSVWWALKQIFDQGLLVEDYRVSPYCPRCGTGLSDHEVAQGYEDVVDPSVYVRFALTSGPWAGQADLLVWTTTPWTLVSNVAVAVNPDVTYVVVRPAGSERAVVVAEPLLGAVLGDRVGGESGGEAGGEQEVLASYPGTELERWSYRRPFDYVEMPATSGGANFVVLADYVTTTDGTGLVHQAPAFGAEDMVVGRRYGLPVVNPVERDGHFAAGLDLVGGLFFKDADQPLIAELERRGLLWRHVPYAHPYPHCWRCHTPLMYFALPSWYIRTTERKDALLRENEATTWYPPTIKHGRYGDWLDNNIDWALSRDRYWGTPLPIWRNDADPARMVCVASLAELGALAGADLSELDPHRPYVDDVTFTRPGEDGTYRRVPQVIDAWFDSGSMPFAQFGAPRDNDDVFARSYPADFICEAIDQTRGWFYTLMAIGTLVFDRSSYKTVLCLGHILAEDGRKMSKHLGNILEPMPLMERHGADALRWFMLAGGSPWSARRVGHKTLEEIASKVLRTYWSIASFQSLYARSSDWTPGTGRAAAEPTVLDRWARAEARRVALEVDAALENFDTARAGALLAGHIDDLSNWYVRRSRRRFWAGDEAALGTLHECLRSLTLLMAPFVPFITETVWRAMFAAESGTESVHLAAWPVAAGALTVDDGSAPDGESDAELNRSMALVRRLVELGRAARAESGVKTRQPLGRALVSAPGWSTVSAELRQQVADELNVVELADLHDADEVVTVTVKANFRSLGRRFGAQTKHVAAALADMDAGTVAHSLRASGTVVVALAGGGTAELDTEDVIVNQSPSAGWTVASDGADTVALDLELSPQLRRLGVLRDVVRLVQQARKDAGLDVSDRIVLHWTVGGAEEPELALREYGEQLSQEVLATTLVEGAPAADAAGFVEGGDAELGLRFWIARA